METIVTRWMLVKKLDNPKLLSQVHTIEVKQRQEKSQYLFAIGLSMLQGEIRKRGGFWGKGVSDSIKQSEYQRFDAWVKNITQSYFDHWDYFENLKSNLEGIHKADVLVLNGDFQFEAGAEGSVLSQLKKTTKERSYSEPVQEAEEFPDEEVPF